MNATLEEPKVQASNTESEMFGKVREKFPKIKGLQRRIKFLWRTDDNLGATPEEVAKKAPKTESNPAYYFRVDYLNPDNHYIQKSLFVLATKKKVVDLTKVTEPRVDNS
jgi:hypothetical protein